MDKIFLTDADGVLLDWSEGFSNFIKKHHPEIDIDDTDYELGLEYDLLQEIVDEFNRSPFFSNLPALRDSNEYIQKFVEDGYKFVVITTCLTKTPKITQMMREQNLKNIFGEETFYTIHCLPVGTDKSKTLSEYKPTYWIDDKTKHCVSGAKAGHTSFQMIHPYNENDKPKGIIPVKSWKEIYEYVLSNPI